MSGKRINHTRYKKEVINTTPGNVLSRKGGEGGRANIKREEREKGLNDHKGEERVDK